MLRCLMTDEDEPQDETNDPPTTSGPPFYRDKHTEKFAKGEPVREFQAFMTEKLRM